MTVEAILQQADREVQTTAAQRIRYKPSGGIVARLQGGEATTVSVQQTEQPSIPAPAGKRKSGYAADLHPDLLSADEKAGLATPKAGDNGAQVGRVAPALIKPTAHYEPVDVDEAMRRAALRRKGELAPIAGGLNDPKVVDPAVAPMDQYADKDMEAGDSSDIVPSSIHSKVVAQPVTRQTQEVLAEQTHVAREQLQPARSKADDYFARRTRVAFIMPNGTYSVPVIDVRVEENGIIILLPCGGNDATFIPNAGSRFSIAYGGQQIPCYFPGTVCTLDVLNITVLAVLRDIQKDAQA